MSATNERKRRLMALWQDKKAGKPRGKYSRRTWRLWQAARRVTRGSKK